MLRAMTSGPLHGSSSRSSPARQARPDALALRALRALYELAQLDAPAEAGVLARALGVRASQAAELLLELDVRGLVCAERARLTLLGLGCAARLEPLQLERASWLGELGATGSAGSPGDAGRGAR